jgi:hypothetical protein
MAYLISLKPRKLPSHPAGSAPGTVTCPALPRTATALPLIAIVHWLEKELELKIQFRDFVRDKVPETAG